ncbi:ChbG/HpnK family deacetylase [Paludibacterium paludis]|uniref:ChbG/HpnK family deacetylase n=1 Tax=Paludibacterium paludis TaxID=1225769 RepID=A0A918U7I1_9NEIS|nr:ChbG/HpnK family deacetylase [Paludibacterium paludis]GGY03289.1 hypothetical protein GCM10011289_01980 [Paludibacterium paludis]
MKRLVLCADDFAQSRAISRGILDLAEAGRITATSVFSLSEHWMEGARQLKPLSPRVEAGLHLTLTEPFDDTARPLGRWLLMSQAGCVPRQAVRRSFEAQLMRFCEEWGELPAYLDGHQHVHALPGIRDEVFALIERHWTGASRPWIRLPDRLGHPGQSRFKASVLTFCCRGFARQAAQRGLTSHAWFGGLYSLSGDAAYRALMREWLAACPDGALMMCHPGMPATNPADPIARARVNEYRYLASPAFAEDLRSAGVELVTGSRTAG